MPKYAVEFTEVQRGSYIYEADNLEHAKSIALEMVNEDWESVAERVYKDGEEFWDEEKIVEITE
jgi:hypothetical protein